MLPIAAATSQETQRPFSRPSPASQATALSAVSLQREAPRSPQRRPPGLNQHLAHQPLFHKQWQADTACPARPREHAALCPLESRLTAGPPARLSDRRPGPGTQRRATASTEVSASWWRPAGNV